MCLLTQHKDEQGACLIIMVILDCSWIHEDNVLVASGDEDETSQSSSSSSDGSKGEGIPLNSGSSDT